MVIAFFKLIFPHFPPNTNGCPLVGVSIISVCSTLLFYHSAPILLAVSINDSFIGLMWQLTKKSSSATSVVFSLFSAETFSHIGYCKFKYCLTFLDRYSCSFESIVYLCLVFNRPLPFMQVEFYLDPITL